MLGGEDSCVATMSNISCPWTPATNLGHEIGNVLRVQGFGQGEIVTRSATRWDALVLCFLGFSSVQLFFRRFLKDACKLYSVFIYSVLALGLPVVVGADLT